MLPHVVAEQRALAVHHRIVLVGTRLDRELAVLGDGDEHPARTEHASAGGVEVVLHLFEPAEVAVDRGQHVAFGLAAVRAHDLPEHGVVGMAAHAVAHAGADRLRHIIETAEHFANRLGGDLRIVLGEIVQIGDERLMMPVVMNLHRFGIDMRLQRRGRIGEGRQRERAGRCGRGRSLRESEAGSRCNGRDAGCGEHEMTSGHGLHLFLLI